MDENMIIRSRRGRGLKAGWFVYIVRWGLKLRCIAKFTQIFRPEDGLPTSSVNTSSTVSMLNIPYRLSPHVLLQSCLRT
jgi:hypothetical protein